MDGWVGGWVDGRTEGRKEGMKADRSHAIIHKLMVFAPAGGLLQGWHLSDSQNGKRCLGFYAEKFLRANLCTQGALHRESFTQKTFCRQKLLHKAVFTHRRFYHRCVYMQRLWRTELLHTKPLRRPQKL